VAASVELHNILQIASGDFAIFFLLLAIYRSEVGDSRLSNLKSINDHVILIMTEGTGDSQWVEFPNLSILRDCKLVIKELDCYCVLVCSCSVKLTKILVLRNLCSVKCMHIAQRHNSFRLVAFVRKNKRRAFIALCYFKKN
jgi:hypothetical protein